MKLIFDILAKHRNFYTDSKILYIFLYNASVCAGTKADQTMPTQMAEKSNLGRPSDHLTRFEIEKPIKHSYNFLR